MRAGFEQFKAFDQDVIDNQAFIAKGKLIACIGIENPAGTPRFTFGSTNLLGGIELIIDDLNALGGRLQNTVIHTYPMVSQFWTYKPEEYLKLPVYNRDYPPCKHC